MGLLWRITDEIGGFLTEHFTKTLQKQQQSQMSGGGRG